VLSFIPDDKPGHIAYTKWQEKIMNLSYQQYSAHQGADHEWQRLNFSDNQKYIDKIKKQIEQPPVR